MWSTKFLIGAILFFSLQFFISGFLVGRELLPRCIGCDMVNR